MSYKGLQNYMGKKNEENENKIIFVDFHCMKYVFIWSYSGPFFPAFGMNTKYLSVFSPNAGKYGPE